MLPGGDLYKQEKAFFDMVSAREESYVEEWLQTLHCPIIRVDGTKSIEENIVSIMKQIQNKSQEDRSCDSFMSHGICPPESI